MTDYFTLLNEPRRPWIEPETLKSKFLGLSAALHPDKIQSTDAAQAAEDGKHFADLNAAYNCLREPKERLRHLLELELGQKPKDLQQIPSDLADLFIEVAALCREVDAFLREKGGVSSPLLRAQMFERGHEWDARLRALQKRIKERHAALIARLQTLDAEWISCNGSTNVLLPQLEETWRLFGFFTRWSGQIQERVAQIAF